MKSSFSIHHYIRCYNFLMKNEIQELAIIGPTASGKSDLAIAVAKKINAYILSIDSLSIYKEIDIVSAKPSKKELGEIKHFGINYIFPNQYFSVDIFMELYKEVKKKCIQDSKNLVIVGGTSFYLKSLLDGLSKLPNISKKIEDEVKKELSDLEKTFSFLKNLDPHYMKNIDKNDSYRIEKALLIFRASNQTPSEWFSNNSPKPIIESLDIFNIEVQKSILKERIVQRTSKMIDMGLIDEVSYLEGKYTRSPNSMQSIGVVEVLEYLDGKVSQATMLENIIVHTTQLAKRQQTFNRSQFNSITHAPLEKLEGMILDSL